MPADAAAEDDVQQHGRHDDDADDFDHRRYVWNLITSRSDCGNNCRKTPPYGLAEGMLEELFWLSELLRQTKGHPNEKLVRP